MKINPPNHIAMYTNFMTNNIYYIPFDDNYSLPEIDSTEILDDE